VRGNHTDLVSGDGRHRVEVHGLHVRERWLDGMTTVAEVFYFEWQMVLLRWPVRT